MGLREEKRQRVEDRLERAALELFVTRGYDQTSMQDVADAAEVSRSTAFRYFSTKDELLFANHGRELDVLVNAARVCDEETASGIARAAVLELAAYLEQEGADLRTRARIVRAEPRLFVHAVATRARWEEALAVEVAHKLGRGEPDLHLRTLAAAALGALHMAVREWTTKDLPNLVPVARKALRFITDE